MKLVFYEMKIVSQSACICWEKKKNKKQPWISATSSFAHVAGFLLLLRDQEAESIAALPEVKTKGNKS